MIIDDDVYEYLNNQSLRYNVLRLLNVSQFHELYKENISSGVSFDTLVDRLVDNEKQLLEKAWYSEATGGASK